MDPGTIATITSLLSAGGDLLGGIGSMMGDDGRFKPLYEDVYKNWLGSLGTRLNQYERGEKGIFTGGVGGELLDNIRKMTSGELATDIGGAIQRQMAPQLTMQIDKLMSSLNPALRGSGIGAQMSRDVTTGFNQNLADVLANLRGSLFTKGTNMLQSGRQTDIAAVLNLISQRSAGAFR